MRGPCGCASKGVRFPLPYHRNLPLTIPLPARESMCRKLHKPAIGTKDGPPTSRNSDILQLVFERSLPRRSFPLQVTTATMEAMISTVQANIGGYAPP